MIAVTVRKFNFPITGTQDLSEAGLTIVVFFAMAYSGWTGGHIAVDLISSVLKGRSLSLLATVSRFVCGAFFSIVTWQTIRQGLDSHEMGDGFNLIDLPRLGSLMPEMAYDLPADQPRLLCRATGYVSSYVAGELVQANGKLTGARPGRVIRGA